MDLAIRPLAPAELRRFVERLGARSLMDETGRAYREMGLAYMAMDGQEVGHRLGERPELLRLPLIRFGEQITCGPAEGIWRDWLTPA